MSDTTDRSQKRTLVEEGTEFKGSMKSSCPIVVMGKIEGDVTGPSIQITPSGVVAGVVRVTELRSDGEVAGEVNADTVTLSGRVRDNTVIRAKTLEVSLSRSSGPPMEVVFGQCELSVGDVPDKEAAIAAATAPPPKPAAATADGADAADWDDKDGQKRKRADRTQPPPMA
jgi:cytoskeletal protein CcmA (bactofilin family)